MTAGYLVYRTAPAGSPERGSRSLVGTRNFVGLGRGGAAAAQAAMQAAAAASSMRPPTAAATPTSTGTPTAAAADALRAAMAARAAVPAASPTATRPAPGAPTFTALVAAETGAFKGIIQNVVNPQLFPVGTGKFEFEAAVWKMIQYPESVYACNDENVRKTTFPADIYAACQVALANLLVAAELPPLKGALAPITHFTPGMGVDANTPRTAQAKQIADWLTCVYSWVSLAMFTTNVQPAMLFPAQTNPVPGGQAMPQRTPGAGGLPNALVTAFNEMHAAIEPYNAEFKKKFPADAIRTSYEKSVMVGPAWMGFYDTAEATGWLDGKFTPQTDPRIKYLVSEEACAPYGATAGKNIHSSYTKQAIRKLIAGENGAWWFWYFTFATAPSKDDTLLGWHRFDTTGVDRTYSYLMPGPAAIIMQAKGWAKMVLDTAIADHVTNAVLWYGSNYIPYWQNKLGDNAELSAGEVADYQTAARDAEQRVKQQANTQVVGTMTGTGVSIAMSINPIAGAVAAGCAILAKGIMALFQWRRRKKKKPPVELMQPLMLRTISNEECAFFSKDKSLPESLHKMLSAIAKELPDAKLNLDAAATVAATGGDATAPLEVAPGPVIATSTSANIPALPAAPTVTTLNDATAAVVSGQLPSTTPPTTGDNTAKYLAISAVAIAGAVLLSRRR